MPTALEILKEELRAREADPDNYSDEITAAWREVLAEAEWKLGKRPVAFRVKNNIGAWVYYDHEERAAASAERQKTDYQGVYVRDGT